MPQNISFWAGPPARLQANKTLNLRASMLEGLWASQTDQPFKLFLDANPINEESWDCQVKSGPKSGGRVGASRISYQNRRTMYSGSGGPLSAAKPPRNVPRAGWGPARGQRPRKGPCASYPTRLFTCSSFAKRGFPFAAKFLRARTHVASLQFQYFNQANRHAS